MEATTIDLLAMSFARVSANKADAASIFYARLFTTAPQLRSLFRGDLEEQKQKLMTSLAEIVDFYRIGVHQERYGAGLGEQHGVQKAHFEAVGDALIFTLAQILGDDFTLQIRSAWITAYSEVSASMLRGMAGVTAEPPLVAVGRW